MRAVAFRKRLFLSKIGDCETGLPFDVQKRQTPDLVGGGQEKVDGDIGKAGMEC